jgi:hypothetical protein
MKYSCENSNKSYLKRSLIIKQNSILDYSAIYLINSNGFNTSLPYQDCLNETNNKLMLLSVALASFKNENEHFPKFIDELCPKYISQIPIDPFSDHKKLLYTNKNGRYTIYSVGPDGVDNKGQIFRQKTPFMKSVGDISLCYTN